MKLSIRLLMKVLFDPRRKEYNRWIKDHGDETLRLDYDLSEDSVVFDVGTYRGQWASDIFSRYLCELHCFEPVEEYYELVKRRFHRNPRIHVNNFGLSNRNTEVAIKRADDGSTVVLGKGEETVQLVRATDFIKTLSLERIDLMKINIEGAEYDLIDDLILSGVTKIIHNMQIQFHTNVQGYRYRAQSIRNALSATHEMTYFYDLIWENWKLKSLP